MFLNNSDTKVRQFKLPESFIEPYKTREVNWGPIGNFIYLRTYSRVVEGENRNEEWWETVRRVVEGTIQIQKRYTKSLLLPWDDKKSMNTAKIMYEKIFSFKFLPPGRGF